MSESHKVTRSCCSPPTPAKMKSGGPETADQEAVTMFLLEAYELIDQGPETPVGPTITILRTDTTKAFFPVDFEKGIVRLTVLGANSLDKVTKRYILAMQSVFGEDRELWPPSLQRFVKLRELLIEFYP